MELTKENRQFPRLNLACDLVITPVPDGKPMSAVSVDISAGGVGFYAKSPLNRDQVVQIDIHLKDENQSRIVERVMGRVVYARSYWEGTRVGVEFQKTIEEADHPTLAKRLRAL